MTVSYRVKLLASHAAIALVVGLVTLVIVDRLVTRRMEHQLDRRLEAQAHAVAQWLGRAGHPNQLARRLAGVVDARVTIIDKHGIAVGESHADVDARPGMDSDGQPVEVRDARSGKVGRQTRFSAFDGQFVCYIAVPAPQELVVRLGLPIGEIDDTTSELRGQLIVAGIGSLILALGLAALVAGPLTRRLRAATSLARRIGAGDYDVPQPSAARDEIGVLSHALISASSELRETDEKRRQFLANVAHEIRTPVTSIRGFAEILSGSSVDADTRKEFLQTIHRNAVRIGNLVENLLELEALEAGKGPPLSRDRVSIAPIAEQVVNTLHASALEIGATIAVSVPADLAMHGDADAIERILLNLADNALRHGGRGVRVEIEGRRENARSLLVVRDSGPGVPADARANIFERFRRGNAAEAPERRGSGLGLAIARELAHAMGGSLSLSDSSTFTLELAS